MTIKKLLGRRIKELRVQKKLTQAQIAELVGIDPKHQSCIENGRNFPSSDLLDKYANVLDINPWVLMNFEHNLPREMLESKLHELIKNCDDYHFKIIYRIVTSILE